jgi:hypothetical protein
MSVKQGTIIYYIDVEDNETIPYIVVGEMYDLFFAIRIDNRGYNCNSHIAVEMSNIKDKCFDKFENDLNGEFNDFANEFVKKDKKKIDKFKKEN